MDLARVKFLISFEELMNFWELYVMLPGTSFISIRVVGASQGPQEDSKLVPNCAVLIL